MTDADLQVARERFTAQIAGFVHPSAYGAARVDDGRLTFGHVNQPGGRHRLPAAVLATFCGYRSATGVFPLSPDAFADAVTALEPAEAATHWDHPNLWSWRRLLEDATPSSAFLAFYVVDPHDPVVDAQDVIFRSLLTREPAG